MRRVRFGIVGMGIGKNQARAIAAGPGGMVTALCDLDATCMAELASELHAPVRQFADYETMCGDPDVDAVFVGTPNQLHAPVALAAVRAGKHVLCTKPLADSEGAARRLVEAVEAAGLVGMMSLSMRFSGPIQHRGLRARRGELGRVYYARAGSVRRSGIPDWGAHFIRSGGGAFRDMGAHVLDAAWWMAGCLEPVSVTGVAGAELGPLGRGYWEYRQVSRELSAQYASDDYGAGLIRFADEAGTQVESFWASHQPDELQIELFGTESGARLSPMSLYSTVDGAPRAAPLRHGLTVQRMLEAVLASAESGAEVRLSPKAPCN